MADSRPHLFHFLSRDELRLALCVAMAAKSASSYQCYPLIEHRTPGYEEATDDWSELVRRAVRYLHFEHGLKLEALRPRRDGRILSTGPIEPGNERYVNVFRSGGFPDFRVLVPKACRFAQLTVPTLDREPLRHLKAEIEAEIERGVRETPAEELAEVAAINRAAFESALEYMTTGDIEGAHDRPVEN
jgi:hypothetical protein